jgi:hypothetical protein
LTVLARRSQFKEMLLIFSHLTGRDFRRFAAMRTEHCLQRLALICCLLTMSAAMQYTAEEYHLQIEIDAKEYELTPEERAHIKPDVDRIGEAVRHFAMSQLWLTSVYHPRSNRFHAQAKLKLPGETIITIAARDLMSRGYPRVRRYIGGKRDWVAGGLATEGTSQSVKTA